ncbi:MAG: hypothetical protein WD651_06090 [Acidimicrobiia bacterium]
MLVRRTLQVALLALVATMVLTVLWNIGLGVGERLWNTGLNVGGEPTIGQTIVSYFRWGRWADLATLLLFAALLIVTPFLPGTRRAGHIVVAGAAIAVVGDLIDLSNLSSPDAGRGLTPDALVAEFTAGRVFGFSTDPTSMYTWAAGIILMGIGLLILSVDAEDRKWSRVSVVLGIAFGVMALTGINVLGTGGIFWLASWIAMGACLYWLLVALKVTVESSGSAAKASQRTFASLH